MFNATTVAWMLCEYPTTFWLAVKHISPIPGTVNRAKNLLLIIIGPRGELNIIILSNGHRFQLFWGTFSNVPKTILHLYKLIKSKQEKFKLTLCNLVILFGTVWKWLKYLAHEVAFNCRHGFMTLNHYQILKSATLKAG